MGAMSRVWSGGRTVASEVVGSIRHAVGRWAQDDGDYPVVMSIERLGLYIWPGFWDAARCGAARDRIDALMGREDLVKQVDPAGSDHRVFGADRLDPSLDIFNDPRLFRLAKQLYLEDNIVGATLAARMRYAQGNRGSGQGWHRDSPVTAQYKFILYLSDVELENGPFQYVLGSGARAQVWKNYLLGAASLAQYRFDDEEDPRILQLNRKKVRTVAAPAGTLIIADTRGIHRGMPIQKGVRYALSNYYYARAVPPHVAALINGPEKRPEA